MTIRKDLVSGDVDFDDVDIEIFPSQQFATVVFHRSEDEEQALITVIHNGLVSQFKGSNKYNPSTRRISTCVYAKEEGYGGKYFKICTLQRTGTTRVEARNVERAELYELFKNIDQSEIYEMLEHT
jgi:hypothetical protein